MNKTTDSIRHRALRIIAGSLLSSSLSDRELNAMMDQLDSEFVYELKRILVSIRRLSLSEATLINDSMPNARESADANDLASLIYSHVKLKKLSRERVEKYIRDINPNLKFASSNKNAKLEGLIQNFVELARNEEAQKLLSKIVGNLEFDPYLDGITRR